MPITVEQIGGMPLLIATSIVLVALMANVREVKNALPTQAALAPCRPLLPSSRLLI